MGGCKKKEGESRGVMETFLPSEMFTKDFSHPFVRLPISFYSSSENNKKGASGGGKEKFLSSL